MKKVIIYAIACVLTLGVMTSCTDNIGNENTNSSPPATNQKLTPNEQIQETESFEPGVFIDFDTISNPLITDDIKSQLKTVLEALANKDEVLFRSQWRSEGGADYFMFLLDREYSFEDIGTVEEDQSGRIVIQVKGLFKDSTGTDDYLDYYYFVKDKNNNWQLGTID
ncbi:hypothetical protein [Paenibacillus jiagnxiensis]|uniref:hypothetical protein n=1 Tax=Paenibacillus jiagnxiensis TaxID=3228926 RepID=UPI0033B53209